MRILITGANGFVGKHLVERLRKEHTVFTLKHKDLVNESEGLEEKIKLINPEAIYHLAAYGNKNDQRDEYEIVNANYIGLFNLLEASKDINYKMFANISSSSVTLNYQTFYSATKMGGEYLAHAFVSEFNKPIINIRPYSLYGPDESRERFIPSIFRSCLNGENMPLAEKASHDWVYIDDFVEELANLLTAPVGTLKKVIEVGTGVRTTNKQVVEIVEEITGKKANVHIVDKLRNFDTEDWVCKSPISSFTTLFTTLKEGLQKYYETVK